jgi:hypothetical protein
MLLFIFISFACEPDWGKYGGYALEYASALEYYIILDKGEEITANDTNSESLKKGLFIKYHKQNNLVDTILIGRGAIVIQSFVNDVKFDNKFILVDQKPIDSICECKPECIKRLYGTKANLSSYKLCEESLRKSRFHQYWIIKKDVDEVYGPFQKERFLQVQRSLGVSDNLQVSMN